MSERSPYVVRLVDGLDPEMAEKIQAMHRLVFGNSAPQVATWEGYWWVAYHSGTPVGFCSLRQNSLYKDTGYLHRAGVLQAHRGQGLQGRFIKAREAKARELGITRLVSDTTYNTRSANNLIKAGYRLFDPEFPWAWSHSLYWEKTLA